jgi:hypothetical protein
VFPLFLLLFAHIIWVVRHLLLAALLVLVLGCAAAAHSRLDRILHCLVDASSQDCRCCSVFLVLCRLPAACGPAAGQLGWFATSTGTYATLMLP